jgi:hypothetical protein
MFEPIKTTITLSAAASSEAVWAALTDATRWPEVLPDLAEGRILPDGKLAPGATLETRAVPDSSVVDMSYRVIAADSPRRLVLESAANGFRAHTEYVLAPGDDGSNVTDVTITTHIMPIGIPNRLSVALRRAQYVAQIEKSVRRRTAALLTLAERA